MIRVTLSGSWTAGAGGIVVDLESQRRGSPICTLARKLLEAGRKPTEELHIYRGEILCFRPAPLAKWAGLRVKEGRQDAARLVPHRQHPNETVESAGRKGAITGHVALPRGEAPEEVPAALTAEGATL